jgi:hypothetical protein
MLLDVRGGAPVGPDALLSATERALNEAGPK